MEFHLRAREWKTVLAKTGNKNQKIASAIRYKDDNNRLGISSDDISLEELDAIQLAVKQRLESDPSDRYTKRMKGRLRTYLELTQSKVTDSTKISRLEAMPIAMKKYLSATISRRWIFREGKDKVALPFFITDIEYHKRVRERGGYIVPASVTMDVQAHGHNGNIRETYRWHLDDLPATVGKLFSMRDIFLQTPEAIAHYDEDLAKYMELQSKIGLQCLAIGDGFSMGSNHWYRGGSQQPMVRDGQPTRVVLDQESEELGDKEKDESTPLIRSKFWGEIPDRNLAKAEEDEEVEEEDDLGEDDDDGDEQKKGIELALPTHPYLNCFDLENHSWVKIHVSYLQDYPWDKTLINKLILPADQKDLINILVSNAGTSVEDIIRGKMKGVIVLATGRPGTGKTLTAEVFSEHIERPLYVVQCSQLGLSVDDIEENLKQVLSRASRWGAVLLIDEADVYIRQRGEDIVQNAIVGVFLRLIEYYRGVLFMTSNRGNIIDDAILSRATAWIQYELPETKLLRAIWGVQLTQYKVKLSKDDLDSLMRKMPRLSGRSVRNLLKLATLLRGKEADVDTVLQVSKYQALEDKEKEEAAA